MHMHDPYQNHSSDELGRIAHEGTLLTRQSAIAELVRRAKKTAPGDALTFQERLANAQNALVKAYGRIETLEDKLRRIREEADV